MTLKLVTRLRRSASDSTGRPGAGQQPETAAQASWAAPQAGSSHGPRPFNRQLTPGDRQSEFLVSPNRVTGVKNVKFKFKVLKLVAKLRVPGPDRNSHGSGMFPA